MISQPLPRLLFAIMLATTLAGCFDKNPAQRIEAARQALQKSDAKAAIIELKSALQKAPGNAEARLLLGQAFLAARQYPSSETELRKAMQLGAPADRVLPDLARSLVKQGKFQDVVNLAIPGAGVSSGSLATIQAEKANAYLGQSQPAQAATTVEQGERALAAVGGNAYSYDLQLAKVRIALIQQKPTLAMELLNSALRHDANAVDALYMKANLLLGAAKTTEALTIYQKILATKPDEVASHLAIYDIKLRGNDLAAAEVALQAAEKGAPNNLMVKFARGNLELRRGHLDKASSALLDVLRVAPNHLPSVLAFAMASYGLGHYDQSMKNAGKVLGVIPDNLIAARILAASQLKVGDLKGALKTLAPLLAKHPDDVKLLALGGEAYFQAKDYNKAMGYLDRAAELEPGSAAIKISLAASHLATGNTNEALSDLESAARLSEKPGQVDLALVMLHMKDKHYDQALQAIASLEKKLPNNPVTHNLRAAALLSKQDRAGSRRELERALAIQPGFFPAAINLARMDMQDHQPDAARKRFETVLAVDKNNVNAMLALADLATANKKENDAVAWLEKAIKADPKAILAYAGLIRHDLARKENAKALAQARQASSANPESLPAMIMLGATQMDTGDKDAAIRTYTHLAQVAQQSPQAYWLLAGAQIANKQLVAARESLQTAIRLKPDFLEAEDGLIRLNLADNKPDIALDLARQIQGQHPKSPLGFDREANIQSSQKHYPLAIKAYKQALDRGAPTASLINLLGTMSAAGDMQGADRFLAAWIKQHPNDRGARSYAAGLYLLGGRNKEAITQYEALKRFSPDDPSVLNNLAILYQRESDPRALATAEQALKLVPENAAVLDTLGWILVEQGQFKGGLDLLGKAVNKAPKAGSIQYHLAIALARSGNKVEAKKRLIQLASSGLRFPEQEAAKAILKSL